MVSTMMQEVSDPKILAQLNETQTSSPTNPSSSTTNLKEVTDPDLLAKLNGSSTGVLGKIDTTAMNLGHGIISGAQSIGGVTHTLLDKGADAFYGKLLHDQTTADLVKQGVDKISSGVNALAEKGKEFFSPQNEFEQNAQSENPKLSGVAGAAGNLLGNVVGGNILAKPVTALASPLTGAISKAIPFVTKSPMVAGVTSNALQGGIIGVSQNPDNPGTGFTLGAATGGLIGGITNKIGHEADITAKVVNRSLENAEITGSNPYSIVNREAIRKELASGGISAKKLDIQQEIKSQIDKKLESSRPETYDPKDQTPVTYLSQLNQDRFKWVANKKEELFARINADKNIISPSTYIKTLQTNADKLRLGLPEESLPANPTLNDLLKYRRLLDAKIQQSYNAARQGTISTIPAQEYENLRSALNVDIHNGAKSIGLEDELNKAESFWKKEYKPYEVFDKNLGRFVTDPEAMNKTLNVISKQLISKKPNYEKISAVANSFGEDGKIKLGWGILQTTLNKATTDGVLTPKTALGQIRNLRASGLWDQFPSEIKETATGIETILKRGSERLQTTGIPKEEKGLTLLNLPSKIVGGMLRSSTGISVLRYLGNNPNAKDMIDKLLVGGTAMIAAKPSK